MAVDDDFAREVINVRERPLSSDINKVGTYADKALRNLLLFSSLTREIDSNVGIVNGAGMLGWSFRPLAGGVTMQVALLPGIGFQYNPIDIVTDIGGVIGLDDTAGMKPLVLANTQQITVPASNPSNPRIDLIEVKYNRTLTEPTSRETLNIANGQFQPGMVNKKLMFTLDGLLSINGSSPINYKTGTPAGVPSPPAVSTDYEAIAYVNVGAGVTAITQSDIVDKRKMMFLQGTATASVRFLMPTTGAFGPPTGVEINAPEGVKVVVQTSTGTSYSAVIIVWCGRNKQISGNFTVYTGTSSTSQLAALCVANRIPATADSGIQASMLTANSVPANTAIGVGQDIVIFQVTPVRIANGGTVSQASLSDPIQVEAVFTILGGGQ